MNNEIKVRSNVPFDASPNLDQKLSQDIDGILLDRLNFLVEDLGITGTLAFREVQPELTAIYPVVYPAGHALPISIEIILNNLSQNGLATVRCALIYEGETYVGSPEHDRIEVLQTEKANLNFSSWIDPDTKEVSHALFPREAINDISYIVKI